MRRSLGLLLLLLLPGAGRAAFNAEDRGTATAQFLKFGAGARALALGGAYTARAGDAGVLSWNPAAAARVNAPNAATLTHGKYLEGLAFSHAAYVRQAGPQAVGISALYFSPGALEEKDADGARQGDFRPSETAAGLTWARRFETGGLAPFSLGVTAKWIASKITRQAHTGALDVGVLFDLDRSGRIRLGGVAQNIGPGLRYVSHTDPLPLTVKLGAAVQVTPNWVLSFDAVQPRDNESSFALGSEMPVWTGPRSSARLRFGLDTRTPADLEGWAGFTTGLGLEVGVWTLDYAFVPYDELGNAHHASLGVKF